MAVGVAYVVAVAELVAVAPGPGQGQVRGVRARLPACVHSVAQARPNDWASLACRLLSGIRIHHALRTSNKAAGRRT
jgi:hypothetical protein